MISVTKNGANKNKCNDKNTEANQNKPNKRKFKTNKKALKEFMIKMLKYVFS